MEFEASPKDTASLKQLAQACEKHLQQCFRDEEAQEDSIKAKSGYWASRQFAEFNLWCTKVGVNGEGLKSIDVRLKDVPEICELLRKLLQSLECDLIELRQPTKAPALANSATGSDSDVESDSSSLSFPSLSSSEHAKSESAAGDAVTPWRKQNLALQRHIEDTIDRLHGHALQITRAGAKHRRERVERYRQKEGPKMVYEGLKELAIRTAKIQFPLASEKFRERMAESFARRRIRFDYLREHQKKRVVDIEVQKEQKAHPEPKSVTVPAQLPQKRDAPKTPNLPVQPRLQDQHTIYSNTIKTKLDTSPLPRRQEPAESVASVALRHPGFPPAPQFNGAFFQCPYCRLDFRAHEAEKNRWSQHVMQDFEPYFCTWEGCTAPFEVPNSFSGLLAHLQDHLEERYHVDMPSGEHKELDETEFEKHLGEHDEVSHEMLDTIKEASRGKGAYLFESCPFCGGYPDVLEKRFPHPNTPEAQAELRKHIKQHMQDIALFLPPHREDIADENDEFKSSIVTRRSVGYKELGAPEDFLIICSQENCDCKDTSKNSEDMWVDFSIQDQEDVDFWAEKFPDSPAYDPSIVTDEYYLGDKNLKPFIARLRATPSLAGTNESLVQIETENEEQERNAILDWLSPIDYTHKQRDLIGRRQPGTGQWLPDSSEYKEWLDTKGQTLFCFGAPGSGKTMLSSIVIDHLASLSRDDRAIGLAYIFFDSDESYKQDPTTMLANILKQLGQQSSQDASLPVDLRNLYERHQTEETRPSLDDICANLRVLIAMFSRVFLVIDALDECDGPDRSILLSELFSLQDLSQIDIFAASRALSEIRERFRNHTQLEIPPQHGDISKYLIENMDKLHPFVNDSPDLQSEIKDAIIKAADGIFLIASLHLDSLKEISTIGAMRTALETLSTGGGPRLYDTFYESTMHRIIKQFPDQAQLAKNALSWLTCTQETLSVAKLQHVLAVKLNQSTFNQNGVPAIEDIVSACFGLITIDEENNDICFFHSTIEEYLKRNQEHWSPSMHSDATRDCIAYLSLDGFNSGYAETERKFNSRLESYPFYSYAAIYWGYHARLSDISIVQDQIVNFLHSGLKVEAASQAAWKPRYHFESVMDAPRWKTGIHLAAYLGLVGEIIPLSRFQGDIDSLDDKGRTPLSWAAEGGHEAVVRLLLETGKVNIDAKDYKYQQTPLSWAAKKGHEAVVRLLLETGKVDVDTKDSQYQQTPLSWAAEKGHEAVVRLLLETGKVDIDTEDFSGQTPLSWAAEKGHEAVVRLLLETGKFDINTKDLGGQTPLSWAAKYGHQAIVRLLLETGKVDINTEDSNDRTPLSWAAEKGHEAVVRLLLETGKVDINTEDSDGRTLLSWAAENGHEVVVRLLLETGKVDINIEDSNDRTPLSWAAEKGYEAVIRLLIETGKVDINTKNRYGRTPLYYATKNDHEQIVELLKSHGAHS